MSKNYQKWTLEEQNLINQVIHKQLAENNKISWKAVSDIMGNKTQRQCYDFYTVHRDKQTTKRHAWTLSETQLLQNVAARLNKNWAEIQRLYFPTFSVSQLRNKHSHLSQSFVENESISIASELNCGLSGEFFSRSRASSLIQQGLGFQPLDIGLDEEIDLDFDLK